MPEITHFHFEEIDLLPDAPGGYSADAMVDGFALVTFTRSGNWWIDNIEIAHTKACGQRIDTRMIEPSEPIKSMVIRRLSSPEWRRSIEDHVCEVLSAERVDERKYEDAL